MPLNIMHRYNNKYISLTPTSRLSLLCIFAICILYAPRPCNDTVQKCTNRQPVEKKPVFALLRGQAAPEKLQPNATVNAILHIIYNKQYSRQTLTARTQNNISYSDFSRRFARSKVLYVPNFIRRFYYRNCKIIAYGQFRVSFTSLQLKLEM